MTEFVKTFLIKLFNNEKSNNNINIKKQMYLFVR
jgi:hypothetical protein